MVFMNMSRKSIKKRDGVYNGFEHIFVFCFLVEWILRMMSSGWLG